MPGARGHSVLSVAKHAESEVPIGTARLHRVGWNGTCMSPTCALNPGSALCAVMGGAMPGGARPARRGVTIWGPVTLGPFPVPSRGPAGLFSFPS